MAEQYHAGGRDIKKQQFIIGSGAVGKIAAEPESEETIRRLWLPGDKTKRRENYEISGDRG